MKKVGLVVLGVLLILAVGLGVLGRATPSLPPEGALPPEEALLEAPIEVQAPRVHNQDRLIVRGGLEYCWYTNTERYRYFFSMLLELQLAGYPIIFSDDAFDSRGRPLDPGQLAVYVACDSVQEVREALKKIRSGPLEAAKYVADDGIPISVWEDFIQPGRIGKEEGHRLLVRAFERTAERYEDRAEQEESETSRTYYMERAEIAYKAARYLRSGEPIEKVVHYYILSIKR